TIDNETGPGRALTRSVIDGQMAADAARAAMRGVGRRMSAARAGQRLARADGRGAPGGPAEGRARCEGRLADPSGCQRFGAEPRGQTQPPGLGVRGYPRANTAS